MSPSKQAVPDYEFPEGYMFLKALDTEAAISICLVAIDFTAQVGKQSQSTLSLSGKDAEGQNQPKVVFKLQDRERLLRNEIRWLKRLRRCKRIIRLICVEQKGKSWWKRLVTPCTGVTTVTIAGKKHVALVVEYLEGDSLLGYTPHEVSIEWMLRVIYAVACTLADIHEHGCVHGDIKPDNILCRGSWDAPILIDFNAAVAAEKKWVRAVERLLGTVERSQSMQSLRTLRDKWEYMLGQGGWIGSRLPSKLQKYMYSFLVNPLFFKGFTINSLDKRVQAHTDKWADPGEKSWEEKKGDCRYDIYSLALVFCYLLSRREPTGLSTTGEITYETHKLYCKQVFDLMKAERQNGKDGWQNWTEEMQTRIERLVFDSLNRDPNRRPSAQEWAAETAGLLRKMQCYSSKKEGIMWWLTETHLLFHWRKWLGGVVLLILSLWLAMGMYPSAVFSANLTPTTAPTKAPTRMVTATPTSPSTNTVAETPTPPATPTPTATSDPGQDVKQEAAAPGEGENGATATATPTQTPTVATLLAQTKVPTKAPTFTPTPTATSTPTVTSVASSPRAPVGGISLVFPGGPSAVIKEKDPRVKFEWKITDHPLGADHCYELLFRQDNQGWWSPSGRIRTSQHKVAFEVLYNQTPTRLEPNRSFDWRVRIVSCRNGNVLWETLEEKDFRQFKWELPR